MTVPDNGESDVNDSQTTSYSALNRRRFLGATATALPVATVGCLGDSGGGSNGDGTTSGDDGEPKQGGTLQWGGSVPVQALDPHAATAAATWRVLQNITEGLTEVNEDYEMEPRLAKDWSLSDNNTTITFELREGVKFHDGSELTAEDVLATYKRVANGPYSASGYFNFVEDMSAPDDYTFEMQLTQPFAPMLSRMSTTSMHIVPKEQAEQDEISEPIGTGPYQFESREINSEFVMTKNDDFYLDGGPYLDKIVKKEVSEDNVRLDKFKAGELDFINDVPPKDIDSVKNDSEIRWEEKFPKILFYLGLNCDEPPFDDPQVRLAMDHAIDREKIIEASLYGYGQIAKSPAYPGSVWEPDDIEQRLQDLDKAKELIDQSDYADGADAVFKIPEVYSTAIPAAQVIAEDVQEIGINLDIQKVTWSNWLSDVSQKRDFQATISTYMGLWYPDYAYYKFEHPEGAFHFTNWENDDYIQTVEDARHTFDVEERADLYHEAARIRRGDQRSGHLLLYWKGYELASIPEYKGKMGAPEGATLRFRDNWLDQ